MAPMPLAKQFTKGAYLDKQVLLGISKRGDRYLRTLLIHGARAVLSHYKALDNDYARWVGRKKATLSHNKVAVALANKNARIIG